MSKYHVNCTKDQPEQNRTGGPSLNSKPFCDCKICSCKPCPDILKLLCISVTEHSCAFGSKVTKDTKKGTCSGHDLGSHKSLLDMVPDRDCACEVVARAVRSHIHMNIGMSEKRAATNSKSTSPEQK